MRSPRDYLKPGLFVLLTLFLGTGITFLRKRTYEWVLVYYMSYDNDLNRYGERILNDLKKGIIDSKIAVVVQADFTGGKGMRRIALYRAFGRPKRKEAHVRSENSADPAELREYLRWVQEKWKAKNYCVVFLDHGGRLNDMCLDTRPFTNRSANKGSDSQAWLPATEAASIIVNFNKKTGGRVRLLFLQQCGRATIQNLYSFVDGAEYIMASPVIVGAPNTYYTKTVAALARDPNVTGEVLAKTIMQEDEHYTVYTLICNDELKKLPEKLTCVLKSLGRGARLNQPQSCSPVFEYRDEEFYDLRSYFEALGSANDGTADEEIGSFLRWCDECLVISKATKGPIAPAQPCDSGLSVYIPSSREQIERYGFLPLHQQTAFGRVMKLMFSENTMDVNN
jgi:hypothetical protein